MPPIPDLVRDSKLETQFSSDPEYTQHIRYVSGSNLERRRVRKEERWKTEKRLGRGSFGDVRLQRCIYGDNQGDIRAVKEVQKLGGNSYYKELEAIAKFSHDKVCLAIFVFIICFKYFLLTSTQYEHCFVKSYGWYDDDESIFIAMEYFPNGDLHKYLGSPLPENECQRIVSQILEGLDFMHENNFTHRDLKPAVSLSNTFSTRQTKVAPYRIYLLCVKAQTGS